MLMYYIGIGWILIGYPSLFPKREDTVRTVFTLAMKRLAIEDGSLFGLMHSTSNGVFEFIPLDHKLKTYAPGG